MATEFLIPTHSSTMGVNGVTDFTKDSPGLDVSELWIDITLAGTAPQNKT